MLRGHVFEDQVFANEAFGLFIDTFLEGNMGVITGCEVSSTNNTATIGAGYFDIKGRFLQIIGNETVTVNDNGYYSLVCEIDLTQENTTDSFNQGSIKAIKGTTTYPTLTQQDINTGGTLYQYEFARFRKTENGITDFVDRRTFLDISSIYTQINDNADVVLQEIEDALDDVLDGSIYVLKTEAGTIIDRNYSVGTEAPTGGADGDIYDQYFN